MHSTAVAVAVAAAAMRLSEVVATPRWVVAIAAAMVIAGVMAATVEATAGEAATAGGAAITGAGAGGWEASGWDCILRACPCTTRRIIGTAFPTTTRMTPITSGTPRSVNTRL